MHPRDAGGALHRSMGKVLFFSSLPSRLPSSLQAPSHHIHPSCCSLLITLFLLLLTIFSLFCSSFPSDLPFDSLPLLCLDLPLPILITYFPFGASSFFSLFTIHLSFPILCLPFDSLSLPLFISSSLHLFISPITAIFLRFPFRP